ncbi:hypothetical protein [Saccharopolyspora sp. 6V]|uniref:hypothetical protein n=1 Tax=Saccharopolyspora sp. 6V TaxID=2877239 RepID=UPI001CD4266C|nr:hypothetical protein [Saccharopolyspora sp. 6V]MCA1191637.1 hypothetical protein [Saccharopolyspora sp. 6V]
MNLPGVDDREMDRLLIMRAMTMVTGIYDIKREPRYWISQFESWLNSSRGDGDRLLRRYCMLMVAELWHHAPEQDPAKVRQTVERYYSNT